FISFLLSAYGHPGCHDADPTRIASGINVTVHRYSIGASTHIRCHRQEAARSECCTHTDEHASSRSGFIKSVITVIHNDRARISLVEYIIDTRKQHHLCRPRTETVTTAQIQYGV